MTKQPTSLGAFSVSLAVKDLGASRAFYEKLGLNGRQIDLIAGATAKRDYYLISRDGCRLFELGLGAAALAFVGASRPEDHQAMDVVLRGHGAHDFAAVWLEARGLPQAAAAIRRFKSHTKSIHAGTPAALVAAE